MSWPYPRIAQLCRRQRKHNRSTMSSINRPNRSTMSSVEGPNRSTMSSGVHLPTFSSDSCRISGTPFQASASSAPFWKTLQTVECGFVWPTGSGVSTSPARAWLDGTSTLWRVSQSCGSVRGPGENHRGRLCSYWARAVAGVPETSYLQRSLQASLHLLHSPGQKTNFS